MIKKLFICIFMATVALGAKAQHDPASGIPDHTPMMTEVWETFDMLMYKVTRSDGKSTYTPHFPPKLKALENTIVTLPGYMVPIESGRQHSNFMLSVLPLMQCMFCGSNGIPPMVEIRIKKGKVTFSDDPIKIRGRVHLDASLQGNAEIQILDAEVIK
jgi:hypothetical protein